MDLWQEFTKKRVGIDRFVVNGLVFAAFGVVWWVLGLVFDSSSFMRPMAVFFVVVGLAMAGVASVVIAYRKRDGASH